MKKIKEVAVTKDNYKELVLKRSIIICWILLIACFIVKICGGNFFSIMCSNEKFIEICNYIDESYLCLIFEYISFVFSTYLFIKITNIDIKKDKLFVLLIVISIYWCFKTLITYNIINISTISYNIMDFLMLFIFLYVSVDNNKPIVKLLKALKTVVYMFLFSIISTITKNIGIDSSINQSFLVGFIFMIDYYIMIVLTYLYVKRRNCKNG